jgi:hypothetical protein
MNTTGRKTVKGRTTSAPKKVEKAAAAKSTKTSTEATSEIASSATMEATTSATAEAKLAPTHDQISLRAYELYLARGSQPGHESEDWLAAETELSN